MDGFLHYKEGHDGGIVAKGFAGLCMNEEVN